MKAIKYFVVGAMLSISATAMAQSATVQAQIDEITKTVVEAKGDVKATKDAVKLFMKSYKKDADALAGLGRAFMKAGNMAEAQRYAALARKVGKNKAAGYILEGDIAAVQDDGGTAASWYQQATMFDPNNTNGYVKYARVYQKIDANGAVEMLEKLRQVKPDYPVDAAAGYMYSQNDRLKTAMEYYDKVTNYQALDDYILYDYLTTAYSLEDYDKALKLARIGIQKNPKYASYFKMAYYAATKKGDFVEAISDAQRYFSTEEAENIKANDYMFYGDALKGAGQLEEAITQYEKAFQMDNTKTDFFKSASEIYLAKKDHAKALDYANKYIDAIGTAATYKEYETLADIYIDKSENVAEGEVAAALFEADKVYGTIADKFDYAKEYAVFKRAAINHQINSDIKKGQAKPFYEQFISLVEPKAEKSASDLRKLATCYNYLAVYYIQNDQTSKSKEYAQKLIELQPDNDTAKQILAL